MGSVGNQNPWAPYNDSKDCSQGICSINCPQSCYFFFPPPPSSENDSAGPLSPLVIAVIGVLAAAFLLVAYYTVVTRYCNRRPTGAFAVGDQGNIDRHHELMRCRVGLDESLIRAIAVREYRAGDGLIEGIDCAVCLTDFREKEPLRILPKCGHAFHVPCIDTWLRSQSSCPLCRAGVIALARPALQDQSVALDVESQRDDDELILVIDDGGDDTGEIEMKCEGEGVVRRFRRSVSLGETHEKDRCRRGIGSSRTRVGLRRSVSTGEL